MIRRRKAQVKNHHIDSSEATMEDMKECIDALGPMEVLERLWAALEKEEVDGTDLCED